jgi:hypothetical protein
MSDTPIISRLDVHFEDEKPLAGWVCAGLGVGFVVLLGALLVAVRLLAG